MFKQVCLGHYRSSQRNNIECKLSLNTLTNITTNCGDLEKYFRLGQVGGVLMNRKKRIAKLWLNYFVAVYLYVYLKLLNSLLAKGV